MLLGLWIHFQRNNSDILFLPPSLSFWSIFKYFSHIWAMGGWWGKAVYNGTSFTVGKIYDSPTGLELGTARSAGQRFTHWATEAPTPV